MNALISEMVVTYNSKIMYDDDTFQYEHNDMKIEKSLNSRQNKENLE